MLLIFRLGAHIPTPGIDGAALTAFFEAQQGSILRFFDMFTGGALARLTVFALGVMPYISASIIIQLMTAVFPYLERLSKEGDAGRKKITSYTRYGTIALSLIQGFAIAVGLESMAAPNGQPIVISSLSPWAFRALTVITLTAGTDLSGYTILGTGSVNAAGPTNSVLLAGITYDLGGSVATGNEIGVLVLETAVSSTVAGDSYFIYTNDWLIPADGANASLTGSGGPYTGSWTVFYPGIPEPSAYPVLAGLIAFGSALLRRRV